VELREYLVQYGATGAFGRFRPSSPVRCQRGDRAVVRTEDGIELGHVLCEATPGHAQFLPNTTVGEFVRLAASRDEENAARMQQRGQELFACARDVAAELALPLEILDAEVLLDGKHARLHYLGEPGCDPRSLMDALADRYQLLIRLFDLAAPLETEEAHEGCGAEGCGGGGCGSCGSTGGCGSCKEHEHKAPRESAHNSRQRVALI
jgi:cell fate regulator YaaT (PSP1 superfamily)